MINPTALLSAIGVMIVLLVVAAASNLMGAMRERQVAVNVGQALTDDEPTKPSFDSLLKVLEGLGGWLRRFYADANIESIRAIIQSSGLNPHRTLPVLLAGKLVMMLLIFAIAATAAFLVAGFVPRLIIVGAGIILGIMGPEWVLGIARRRFTASLNRGTPDALDLLVVCSEAGLGLESALDRVSLEMKRSNPPMSSVLASLLDDLRVLPNRRDAFNNLAARGDALRRLGTMLSQSIQYGTPLSRVLRSVADELRRDRMNKLEEKAVKLPAKLIFPLIFFIMPSLYIVLLGPSFMRLYDSLSSFALSFPAGH